VAFVDDIHTEYRDAEGGLSPDAASAIAQGVNVITDIVLGTTASRRDADLQRQQAARDFAAERDRLERQGEQAERESRKRFALGAVQELRKSDQKKMIQNIAIGVGVFAVLAIGIYYAGKK